MDAMADLKKLLLANTEAAWLGYGMASTIIAKFIHVIWRLTDN
jgi:hypothetical protein